MHVPVIIELSYGFLPEFRCIGAVMLEVTQFATLEALCCRLCCVDIHWCAVSSVCRSCCRFLLWRVSWHLTTLLGHGHFLRLQLGISSSCHSPFCLLEAPVVVYLKKASLPPFVGGWYFSVSQVYGVFTCFVGGLLDLMEHDLLVVVYPSVMGQFLKFLEELVTIWVGRLPELFPLCILYLHIRILPKPGIELRFEVFIGGILLFPVCVPSYQPGI